MSSRLRRSVSAVRHRLVIPILLRLDGLDQRLDLIDRRLTAIEASIATVQRDMDRTSAQAASVSEQTLVLAESEARQARRLEEIGSLLGDGP